MPGEQAQLGGPRGRWCYYSIGTALAEEFSLLKLGAAPAPNSSFAIREEAHEPEQASCNRFDVRCVRAGKLHLRAEFDFGHKGRGQDPGHNRLLTNESRRLR